MKDNYLDVQGEVACGRNGCLTNWLNGLWMEWLIWKKCMCELALCWGGRWGGVEQFVNMKN
jgi:predicted NBD/HSP70 family sugar kinase